MKLRKRRYEQSQEWRELKAYLQYVTRGIFGDTNQTIGVQYGEFAYKPSNTQHPYVYGVLVTFPHYSITYPCDPKKENPGVVIRQMLGSGGWEVESPSRKKVFQSTDISTYEPQSYAIAGTVTTLHQLASTNDPDRFNAAQEWDKQRKKARGA